MSELATVVTERRPRRKPGSRSTRGCRNRLVAVGDGHSRMLDASIRRLTTVLSVPSHEHWTIRMPAMRRIANVELSADWLSISVSLRLLSMPINFKIIGTMLCRNARINGSSRIIGKRQKGGRQIVVDIPVDTVPWHCEADLDALIDATITGLDAALSQDLQHTEPLSEAGLHPEQLEAVFDAAGWLAQSAEGECLDIPLEVPGSYVIANVRQENSSTRLIVPVLAGEIAAAPALCRDAVTVLLWLTCSRLRMVKATKSRHTMTLEVSTPVAQINEIALAHACTALSAALQIFLAEAELLIADEALAQIYLANLEFQSRHEESASHADTQHRLIQAAKGVRQ